jgi:pimeloyl-ACP methyl ester carboxylesterase
MSVKSPFLLIHGAWHGAWCWTPVVEYLVTRGHPVLALDMPGHGLDAPIPESYGLDAAALATEKSALGEISLTEYAEPAIEATRRLHATYGPVVVVGHSLAGVVLNVLGEAAPEAVERLVYLAAFAPAPGKTAFADAERAGFATSLFLKLPVADPAQVGAVRLNWRSEDAEYRETAAQCFYGDVDPAVRAAAARLLSPDEPVRLYSDEAPVTPERWGSLPHSFIRTTQDRAVPVEAQDEFIAELDTLTPENAFDVRTIESSHSPFLSQPAALADILSGLASGNG